MEPREVKDRILENISLSVKKDGGYPGRDPQAPKQEPQKHAPDPLSDPTQTQH